MLDVTVSVDRALLTVDEDFIAHCIDSFDAGVVGLTRDVRRFSPIDLGDLREGFYADGAKLERGEFTAAIANDTPAALYRVRGRGPGKMPPIDAVEGWARRRGISPYLVARSIGRRGTARWRENQNVLDIERTSQPGNEIPKRNGKLIETANAIARNVNRFKV